MRSASPCVLRFAWVATCVAITAVAGCGRGVTLCEVRGKVTLDGQPLPTGVVVSFTKAGKGAFGIIQPDGTFTLVTRDKGNGILPGVHRLVVKAFKEKANASPEDDAHRLVPARYMSPETSGFSVTATPGKSEFVILELHAEILPARSR
ncbi:MAG: hypothetical protein IT425_07510 [Pirellulales bacterium]|nr:hypothetical protein [Pirellulales bacterium]